MAQNGVEKSSGHFGWEMDVARLYGRTSTPKQLGMDKIGLNPSQAMLQISGNDGSSVTAHAGIPAVDTRTALLNRNGRLAVDQYPAHG